MHPSAASSRVVDLATYPRMSFTSNEEMIARPISFSVMSSDTRFRASWYSLLLRIAPAASVATTWKNVISSSEYRAGLSEDRFITPYR